MDTKRKEFPASTPKDGRNLDCKLSTIPCTPVSKIESTPSSNDSGYTTFLSLSASTSSSSSGARSTFASQHLFETPCFSRYRDGDTFLDTADKAIGCRSPRVDFLEKFCDTGIDRVVVSTVFGYLDGRSLAAVCCVNKQWRSLCLGDAKANCRRKLYLAKVVTNKENFVKESSYDKDEDSSASGISRTPRKTLLELNVCTRGNANNAKKQLTNAAASKTTSKHLVFSEEGKKLSANERLEKCPRCLSPARVDTSRNRSLCTKPQCLFIYCTLCKCAYHTHRECAQLVSVRPDSLKANRKNLRRL